MFPQSRGSPSGTERPLHTLSQPSASHSFPKDPELEAIGTAATLGALVPCVQGHVIELVPLEQVRGPHAMAALQEPLGGAGGTKINEGAQEA